MGDPNEMDEGAAFAGSVDDNAFFMGFLQGDEHVHRRNQAAPTRRHHVDGDVAISWKIR